MKRLSALLLALWMALALVACGAQAPNSSPILSLPAATQSITPAPTSAPEPSATSPSALPTVIEEEYYYDPESVVLYLHTFGFLPYNYITKNDARALGWEGGSVERFKDGAAIGGDRFGNYEGLLPKMSGRTYYECDLNTNGANARGGERLIFSNDGLYFYTSDHYESFQELYVTEGGIVVWK